MEGENEIYLTREQMFELIKIKNRTYSLEEIRQIKINVGQYLANYETKRRRYYE